MKKKIIFFITIIIRYTSSFTPKIARITTAKIRHAQSASNNAPSSLPDINPYYEYQKTNKELQWLLRTTSKIIGPSFPLGELPASSIRKFPLIMRAWKKRCSIPNSNAAHVAERLLERLIDEKERGNEKVIEEGVLCTNNYNAVIESWARMSGKEFRTEDSRRNSPGGDKEDRIFAAERASIILQKMEDSALSDEHLDVKPDNKSYWMTMQAWSRTREPCAVDEIGKILHRLETLPDDLNGDMRPTIQFYNLYLYTLANRRSKYPKKDVKIATEMLEDLKARCVDDIGLTPDTNTFNQVISTCAKLRSFDGANRAQAVFDKMIDESSETNIYPDTNTFNALMNCWLKSGPKRGRPHIERLLNRMTDLNKDGHTHASPDRFSVNTAISAVAKSYRKDSVRKAYYMLMNMESEYGVSADTTSYNLVLDSYAKSRDFQAGKKANNLLKKMEEMFINGNKDVMPDSFSYSTVIDAITTTRGDNGVIAEDVLGRMEKLCELHGGKTPDTAVYNSLMNVYSTKGDNKSIQRTEALLHYMEESYLAGNENVKPNIISYNTALKAFSYAREDFTKNAEDLLNRLERTYSNKSAAIAPDTISYTTVISCYARSDVQWKSQIAQRILHQMLDAYKAGNLSAKPSIFPFNACLNACAYTFDQKEKVDAFLVAVSTLVLLQEYTKPDHTTYGTLLKAWCNLIPKDDERRQRVVKSVFTQCCKEGQVGTMVMQQLKYAASPDLYRELVGMDVKDDVKMASLPSHWSRNVKERNGKISKLHQR